MGAARADHDSDWDARTGTGTHARCTQASGATQGSPFRFEAGRPAPPSCCCCEGLSRWLLWSRGGEKKKVGAQTGLMVHNAIPALSPSFDAPSREGRLSVQTCKEDSGHLFSSEIRPSKSPVGKDRRQPGQDYRCERAPSGERASELHFSFVKVTRIWTIKVCPLLAFFLFCRVPPAS